MKPEQAEEETGSMFLLQFISGHGRVKPCPLNLEPLGQGLCDLHAHSV